MNDTHHVERERFFGAAKVVAGLTLLSRILGLLRDRAIFAFGANRLTDTFWAAFRIPNTFRRLFGEGALSAAFVPVFTHVAEAQGWAKARLVLANTAGVLAMLLAAILLLVEGGVGAWLIVRPGAWDRTLLLQLLLIVMPFMVTVCLLALGAAALQCKGRFAYPAFAPVILNVCMIVAALAARAWLAGASQGGLFLLASAVIVAGVVQLAGVVWMLHRVGLAVVPRPKPILPEVKRMGKLFLPMLVPLGVVQFSSFFDGVYAWWMTATPESPTVKLLWWTVARPLEDGVVTHLYAAERLYSFPMGILAISIATVVFPLFSRYASRNDTAGLRDATNRALRLCGFLAIPAGVALIVLAEPAIATVYRSGKFQPRDVADSAYVLRMYCLGMWAYFCNHILLRAFFSRQDVRTPLRVSICLSSVNIILVAALVFSPLRAGAIGLATATTSTANSLILIWVLRSRWGRIGFRRIVAALGKTALATAGMAGAMWAAWRYVFPWVQRLHPALQRDWAGHFAPAVVLLILCIFAGLGVWVVLVVALRCEELRELRSVKE
ncbi:MAG: murein biosynthesis integral membrane protein MurJ [Phycisphaerae bacterium]|nr:murein biosynthesis integral membrane protein MurJ [Phycisphaerae bacterium]